MDDWWEIVFEQLRVPKEYVRLGLTCKDGVKKLQKFETRLRNYFSDEKEIKHILSKTGFKYIPIESIGTRNRIADVILRSAEIKSEPDIPKRFDDTLECHYFGVACSIRKRDDLALTYYFKSVEAGYTPSMYNVAYIFECRDDTKNMKKYLLMGCEKGCTVALGKLGSYYNSNSKFEKAEKCWLTAIEKGDDDRLNELAQYYIKYGRDVDALRLYDTNPVKYKRQLERLCKREISE